MWEDGRHDVARSRPQNPRMRTSSSHEAAGGLHAGSALRLIWYQLQLVGHSAELGKRTGLHLLHRPAAVHLHRGFRDADLVGDLFAQAAARDLNHDLTLPGTQRGEAL